MQHHEHRQHETTPTNGPVHAYPGPGPPGRSRQVARPHAERLRCSWRRRGRSGPRSVLARRPHTPASPKNVSSPQAASRAVPAARRRATRHGAPWGGWGRPCTQGRRGECQGEGIGASEKLKKSMGMKAARSGEWEWHGSRARGQGKLSVRPSSVLEIRWRIAQRLVSSSPSPAEHLLQGLR